MLLVLHLQITQSQTCVVSLPSVKTPVWVCYVRCDGKNHHVLELPHPPTQAWVQ